jgi:hypothetical protein
MGHIKPMPKVIKACVQNNLGLARPQGANSAQEFQDP